MTNDDLSARLQRVYTALHATLETDINKALPIVPSDARSTAIYQDFRGDLSDPEMETLAYALIHNLANLRDHSRRWMAKNGHDAKQVDAFTSANPPVAILQALSRSYLKLPEQSAMRFRDLNRRIHHVEESILDGSFATAVAR